MKQLTFSLALFICISAYCQVKPTAATDRIKKIQQRKDLEQQSIINHISFRNIGPVVMSGRVDDIEVNPDDPTEFYVAFATGGLWHTVNNGLSFTPIFDSEDVIGIGDIAVNWKTKTIWVGTGEVNSSRSSYAGIGVYKSTDNGKNWSYLGLPESHHIGKIQLHPTNNDIAWVAVLGHLYSPNKERGIYKTSDAGKTWKQTLYVNENTGAVEMEINPKNPNELYAAMWYRTRTAWNFEESGKSSGLYKSTDGGESWNLISTNTSGLPTGDGMGRMGIAVFPENPQIVYVVVDNQSKKEKNKTDTSTNIKLTLKDLKNQTKESFAQLDNKLVDSFFKANRFPAAYNAELVKAKVAEGTFKPTVIYDYLKGPNDDLLDASSIIGCEVYRSDDGGINWKKTNLKSLDRMYSTYGYYFGKIAISAYNPDKVIITGVPIMMSTDAGKEFKTIDGNNVHSDHHIIWMNPKKDSHMINGNDGGVNITYDDGKVWFKANSIPVGQFYSVSVDDAKPYNVYGGLQDNGVWYMPSQNPRNSFGGSGLGLADGIEKNIGGGDGMQVFADTRDNATYYAGSQFGAYFRGSKNGGQRKSLRARHELGETPLRFNWETPILLSKHNQDIFFIASNRVHRSFNQGDSIANVSNDLTKGGISGDVPYGTLTCIAESHLRFGLLYVGSDDGLIHISKDAGNTWQNITGKLPKDLWVSSITTSSFKEGRVYVSMNGYRNDNFNPFLFVSDDYGTSWKQIGTNLPMEPINVVKEDYKNASIIYVGTDGGLYTSLDEGNKFMMWNKGLPKSIPVHDIAIQTRENEIVLGTHGRSIYIAKLDEVQKAAKK